MVLLALSTFYVGGLHCITSQVVNFIREGVYERIKEAVEKRAKAAAAAIAATASTAAADKSGVAGASTPDQQPTTGPVLFSGGSPGANGAGAKRKSTVRITTHPERKPSMPSVPLV
jgi:hypothetical protein